MFLSLFLYKLFCVNYVLNNIYFECFLCTELVILLLSLHTFHVFTNVFFFQNSYQHEYARHVQSTPFNTIIMFVPQQEAWVVERMGKFNRILQPVSTINNKNTCIVIFKKITYRFLFLFFIFTLEFSGTRINIKTKFMID